MKRHKKSFRDHFALCSTFASSLTVSEHDFHILILFFQVPPSRSVALISFISESPALTLKASKAAAVALELSSVESSSSVVTLFDLFHCSDFLIPFMTLFRRTSTTFMCFYMCRIWAPWMQYNQNAFTLATKLQHQQSSANISLNSSRKSQ